MCPTTTTTTKHFFFCLSLKMNYPSLCPILSSTVCCLSSQKTWLSLSLSFHTFFTLSHTFLVGQTHLMSWRLVAITWVSTLQYRQYTMLTTGWVSKNCWRFCFFKFLSKRIALLQSVINETQNKLTGHITRSVSSTQILIKFNSIWNGKCHSCRYKYIVVIFFANTYNIFDDTKNKIKPIV